MDGSAYTSLRLFRLLRFTVNYLAAQGHLGDRNICVQIKCFLSYNVLKLSGLSLTKKQRLNAAFLIDLLAVDYSDVGRPAGACAPVDAFNIAAALPALCEGLDSSSTAAIV